MTKEEIIEQQNAYYMAGYPSRCSEKEVIKNNRCNRGVESQKRTLEEQLAKAKELLKWALHSDPEHDDLVDFDTKWNECKLFLQEEEGEMTKSEDDEEVENDGEEENEKPH